MQRGKRLGSRLVFRERVLKILLQKFHVVFRDVIGNFVGIRALTEGNGADVVIDAVGRPETYKQAFYARDLAGRVVLVGVPTPEMQLELPLLDVFGRGGSLKSVPMFGSKPANVTDLRRSRKPSTGGYGSALPIVLR